MTSEAQPAIPDPVCVNCGHKLILKGEPNTSQYWQCEYNCRCLMIGCTPKLAKYGTE